MQWLFDFLSRSLGRGMKFTFHPLLDPNPEFKKVKVFSLFPEKNRQRKPEQFNIGPTGIFIFKKQNKKTTTPKPPKPNKTNILLV